MKKLEFLLFVLPLLFLQCSSEFDGNKQSNLEISFTDNADLFGKAVAQDIRFLIENLDKEDFKYKTKAEFNRICQDQYQNILANHGVILTKSEIAEAFHIDYEKLNDCVINLTENQLNVALKLSEAEKSSISLEDYKEKLLLIKDYVIKNIPEIEQERLLLVISGIYLGVNEIQKLINEGYMERDIPIYSKAVAPPPASSDTTQKPGPTPGSLADWCKQSLSTVWLIAAVEPTQTAKLIATGYTILVSGVLLYQFYVVCSNNPTIPGVRPKPAEDQKNELTNDECILFYEACVLEASRDKTIPCYDCLRYCQGQHIWDYSRCSIKSPL